jgi:L-threonylcarbamoyladenylate synthase
MGTRDPRPLFARLNVVATEVLRVSATAPDPDAIRRAASVILEGGLVAFPTETVYGLGALADDADSIAKIYAAKGRPAHNPLIAHVPGEAEAQAIAGSWPAAASTLARALWPGPLTLVVPRGAGIPRALSAGLEKMAIRAPNHPVALALLRAVGRPVAAPSANPSMQLSPTRAEHVVKGLGGRIDLVLDAGPCALGIESTVVDVTSDPPVILRPGSLSIADLAPFAPGIRMTRGPRVPGPQLSPGMDAKHYAPRARVVITTRAEIRDAIGTSAKPVGLVTRGSSLGHAPEKTLPSDAMAYAAGLFDALHALDDEGVATIVVEALPDEPSWAAVRDRLERASAD